MANRYWVGGTGTWDTTTTANWSATSGGAGGASTPTYADSVFFNSASNASAYTVTMNNGFTGTGTISGTVLTITAVTTGALAVGNSISSSNLPGTTTYISGGTYITSLGTGTGGIGTYNLNISQTTASTTIIAGPTCLDITIAGPASGAITLSGAAATITSIYGSMTLPATNLTWSATSIILFCANTTGKTITTNGVTILGGTTSYIAFDGVGGGWTLGSALTANINSTSSLRIVTGIFDTGNFNITLTNGALYSSGTTTRTINLGSSTITTSNATTAADFTTTTGLTFNAGTSTFVTSASSPVLYTGGLTFYNVLFSSSNANGTVTISGASTYNNLTMTSSVSNFMRILLLSGNQIINGTLTLGASNNATTRLTVGSTIIGVQRTITLNGTLATLSDVDFRDIKVGGTATVPWTGTRLGNCHGNDETTITFSAGVNKYWNLSGGGSWTSVGWATSSGGTPATNNFPLAQDTIIITDSSPTAGSQITFTGPFNIGNLDLSGRTIALTLSNGIYTPTLYEDLTLSSAVTISGTGNIRFYGQKANQRITSAGCTWTSPVVMATNTAIGITLVDSFTTSSTSTFTLTQGILNLNNNILTAGLFVSSNLNTRAINFGTGNIVVTGTGTVWAFNTTTGLTTTGTQIVNVTNATSTAVSVVTGFLTEANAISFNFTAGTYNLTFLAVNGHNAKNINFTGFSGIWAATNNVSVYGNLTLSPTMTLSASTNTITFASTTTDKTITTNGQILDFPINFNGSGGSWVLQDSLTIGSTRQITLANGTLNLNSKTITVGTGIVTATGTKNIMFNGGTIVCPASSATAFNNAVPTGFSTTAGSANGVISMTGATAKTFVGGSSNYAAKLSQDGLGALTITGSNTFTDIINTVQPTSILFTAATTTTVYQFSVQGTASNLLTISSVTAAQYTLSKASDTVILSNCSISYSKATGGATWTAPANKGNIDAGNNTGWNFAAILSAIGNFFAFF